MNELIQFIPDLVKNVIDNKPKKTKEKQPVLESVRSKDNYDKICNLYFSSNVDLFSDSDWNEPVKNKIEKFEIY